MTKTYYMCVTLSDGKDVAVIYDSEFNKGTAQHYVDFLRQLSANEIHLANTMNRDNLMKGARPFKHELDDEIVIRL